MKRKEKSFKLGGTAEHMPFRPIIGRKWFFLFDFKKRRDERWKRRKITVKH